MLNFTVLFEQLVARDPVQGELAVLQLALVCGGPLSCKYGSLTLQSAGPFLLVPAVSREKSCLGRGAVRESSPPGRETAVRARARLHLGPVRVIGHFGEQEVKRGGLE